MHTDEAVHAIKFGELLEKGTYTYDPIEYHGPTLNYFTLISAYISGENNLQNISEVTLRLVSAIISLLLIASLLLLYTKNNIWLILLTASLITISPVFQFYSRYYIQEVLLVTFSYTSIFTFYRYFLTKKILWLILSGMLVGLTFATKETSIITFFAVFTSLFYLYIISKDFREKIKTPKFLIILFVLTAALIAILFYSSFFQNPKGISDSVLTYFNYFNKAGNNIAHKQPWYYYINLILFSKTDLILYSGIPVFIFTIIGFYFAFTDKREIENIYFFKFIAIFSITQAMVYSFISYKTPWLILNFWIGFLILAAFGIFQLFAMLNNKFLKTILSVFIVLVFVYNIYQLYLTSFKYPYQPENPFTYSQPTPDIILLSNKIISIAEANSDSNNILINVIVNNNDYWPLPWYLRMMRNVAWNNHVPNNIYKFPIIIASPNFEDEIINKLYSIPPPGKKNLYVPLSQKYFSLRPNIEIRGYVQKKYYDFYLRSFENNNL